MVADGLSLPSVTSVRYSTLTSYFETKGVVYSNKRERERKSESEWVRYIQGEKKNRERGRKNERERMRGSV